FQAIAGVDRPLPTVAHALFLSDADDLLPARVGVNAPAVGVGFEDADRRGGAERAEPLFAAAQIASPILDLALHELMAGLQLRLPVGGAFHIAQTLLDGQEEHAVLEDHPPGVLESPPGGGRKHAVNGLRPEEAAEDVVG